MPDENTQETKGNGGGDAGKAAEAKKLFDGYEAVCDEEKQLDDMMASIRAKKSAVVQEIEKLIGKGPFEWKGQELVITKRGDTHYFRTRGKSNVTVIA